MALLSLNHQDNRWFRARLCRSSICLFLLIFSIFASVPAQTQTQPEYKLKAVYLFNFIQYVDWPETAFEDEKSPFIVGVLGNDPFGTALDDTVRGEVLNGRPLQLRRYKSVKQIEMCHLLYISASEANKLKSILASLRGRSILTVSDMEDFAYNGGAIRFLRKDHKIGFGINIDSTKAAGLSVSSKLLQLSEVISTQK